MSLALTEAKQTLPTYTWLDSELTFLYIFGWIQSYESGGSAFATSEFFRVFGSTLFILGSVPWADWWLYTLEKAGLLYSFEQIQTILEGRSELEVGQWNEHSVCPSILPSSAPVIASQMRPVLS